jgi:PAS domain S-box-containing protein
MAKLFGRDTSELIGLSDEEIFDEQTAARVAEMDRHVLSGAVRESVGTSRVRGVEYTFHTVKVPLRDDDGAVVGLCGIARDISEIKRAGNAERVLREILHAAATAADLKNLISKIRDSLGTVLDTTNFYVALYDEATGCYAFPYYADQYDALEVFEPEPLPQSLTDYVRRTGKPILLDEAGFRELTAAGEVGLVGTDSAQWLGAPLETDRGVIGVVAVQSYHDARLYSQQDLELLHYAAGTISIAVERKRAEEERQELEAKVLQVQKMESLGVLAGGIAHEFNNMLQAILASAGLAMRDLPEDSPALQQIRAIERTTDDAARLTRQMLAYSGKGRFIVQDLDLSALVDEMRQFLVASMPDSSELRFELADDLPCVTADVAEIRQLVINIVTNASEALDESGGVVTVVTRVENIDRDQLSSSQLGEELPAGEYVVIEVTDTGSGMTPDTVSRVFDPFFSTKFTGRGLGMPAVLGIVRASRGAIGVDSAPGRGTTVRVLLPTGVGGRARLLEIPEVSEAEAGMLTVLVVDDDDTIRDLSREMLEQAGFEVVTASDGREAVDLFRDGNVRFDAVLLDMTMPRMNGEQTFNALQELRSDVPVIVSSGYSAQDAMDRFVGSRPAEFLQKPYRFTELVEAVYKVCGRS